MGVANIFARPGWREFFLAVATAARCATWFMSAGSTSDRWTAIDSDSSTARLLSRAGQPRRGQTSRFGPGVAHLRDLLRYAIEHGMNRFDFTIGDERYKLEWSDLMCRSTITWRRRPAAWAATAAAVATGRRHADDQAERDALGLVSRSRAAIGLKVGWRWLLLTISEKSTSCRCLAPKGRFDASDVTPVRPVHLFLCRGRVDRQNRQIDSRGQLLCVSYGLRLRYRDDTTRHSRARIRRSPKCSEAKSWADIALVVIFCIVLCSQSAWSTNGDNVLMTVPEK